MYNIFRILIEVSDYSSSLVFFQKMKRKLSPPHLRPSSKLGVPDYSSRARESFLEDQHVPQAKVRFNDWLNELRNDCEMTG